MMKPILVFLFAVLGTSLWAQLDSLWSFSLLGEDWSAGQGMVESADGSVYWHGVTTSLEGDFLGNQCDSNGLWVAKIDEHQELVWINTFNDGCKAAILGIAAMPDGNLMCVGRRWIEDRKDDAWVAMLSSDGVLLWEATYGGPGNDRAFRALVLENGHSIILGQCSAAGGDVSTHYGKQDIWLLEIDEQGKLLWENSLGGSEDESGIQILQDGDGFLVVGSTESADEYIGQARGGKDIWLVKTDRSGNWQWGRTYGGSDDEFPVRLLPKPDGGYMLCGTTRSTDQQVIHPYGNKNGIWVVELNADFVLSWGRVYGGSNRANAVDMVATSSGNYIIGSRSLSQDGDVTADPPSNPVPGGGWLFEIGTYGKMLWDVKLGMNRGEDGFIMAMGDAEGDGFYISRNRRIAPDGSFVQYIQAWLTKFSLPKDEQLAKSNCSDVFVHPNPLSGRTVHLKLAESTTGTSEIILYDMLGRQVFSRSEQLNGLAHTCELPSALAAGHYVLELRSANRVCRRQIVIAR